MDFTEKDNKIYEITDPIAESLGYKIVEIQSKNLNDDLYISIVIYSPNGISIDDCSRLHKTLQGRIETFTEDQDIYIEVSSPGINRNIKSAGEFAVFKGKKIKLLLENQAEWQVFIIKETDNNCVTLEIAENDSDETVKIKYSDIRKAKLEN